MSFLSHQVPEDTMIICLRELSTKYQDERKIHMCKQSKERQQTIFQERRLCQKHSFLCDSSLKPFGAVFVPLIDMINLSINFNKAPLDCTHIEKMVIELKRIRLR